MSFLVRLIRDQKFNEAEADLLRTIDAENISPEAWVYEIKLSKSRFKTDVEALEYVKDKGFYSENMAQDDSEYIFQVSNKAQLNTTSAIEFEVSRGVIIKAADFRPQELLSFNSKRESGELLLRSVDLNEGTPVFIEICRVISGYHVSYGDINITADDLKSFVKNFHEKAVGVDLAINEDHKKEKAYGWIIDVFLSQDEQILYGHVNWNSAGTKALSGKEYRYFSPELKFNFVHPHTGKEYGPTLTGGALTNYPFLKMDAIVELNNKNQKGAHLMELKDFEKKVVELNSKISEQEKELSVGKTVIENLKKTNVELSEKVSTLEKEKQEVEKKAKHEKLFSEGKISKAQLVALNEGKDLLDVLSLNGGLHTKADGVNGKGDEVVMLSDEDKAMAAKLGLTEKEYIENNKN